MADIRTLKKSFIGGEISPLMFTKLEDAKYQNGVALCRNMIVTPLGALDKRPGYVYAATVKDVTKMTRLIPFLSTNTDSMIIEMGHNYFRFYLNGEQVTETVHVPGPVERIYEIAHPYDESQIWDVHFTQSRDIITLVHQGHHPRELRYYRKNYWECVEIDFTPPVNPPTGVAVTTTVANNTKYTYEYVVTSVFADNVTESKPSAKASVASNIYINEGYNTITWPTVVGAQKYNIYKNSSGIFGFIGSTDQLSIKDDNIAADTSKTPPIYDVIFLGEGQIVSVPVTAFGNGYGADPGGGVITGVTLANNGAPYREGLTIGVTDPTGTGASFRPVLRSLGYHTFQGIQLGICYAVEGVEVINGGHGYTNPTITFSAQPVRTDKGPWPVAAVVSAIYKTALDNTVSLGITDATGYGAHLTPNIVGGQITSVNVIKQGANYTAPLVYVSAAAGGSGAAFGTAVLTGGDHPGAVGYFEQRRVFGGFKRRPDQIFMTRVGTESAMTYSLPLRDDDRINFQLDARDTNIIRHIVNLKELIILTNAGEFRVSSVNTDAITPTSIKIKLESANGASNVMPVVVSDTVVYCADSGNDICVLRPNASGVGYMPDVLSYRASHLFDNVYIRQLAFSRAPYPIVWGAASNGKLYGLTYIPSQQVDAWHQHDTNERIVEMNNELPDIIESVATIPEGNEVIDYIVVRRTINGIRRRYIEYKASSSGINEHYIANKATHRENPVCHLDCAKIYKFSTETTLLTGLSHLENETVSIVTDGAVHKPIKVVNGQITLEYPAMAVHVGFPIRSQVCSLPLDSQVDEAFGRGRSKNVKKATFKVYRSSTFSAGPDEKHLVDAKIRTNEPYGSPPDLKTGDVEIPLTPSWGSDGQIFIEHTEPLPLTITSMMFEVEIGG